MKKRKYLFRLTSVIVLMLVIPTVIFFTFFWKRSLNELETSNKVYYEEVRDSALHTLEERVRELNRHTALLSVKSRKNGSVFQRISQNEPVDEYWTFQAMKELQGEFYVPGVKSWGVYIYSIDKSIQTYSVMSSDQFLTAYSADNSAREIREMLSAEEYQPSRIFVCRAVSGNASEMTLLLGICTTLGYDNTKALVFYAITQQEADAWMYPSLNQGLSYFLTDTHSSDLLFQWGESSSAAETSGKDFAEYIRNGETDGTVFTKNSRLLSLRFVVALTGDSMKSHMDYYFAEARNLLLITAFILIVVCFAALFVAYMPVYRLIQNLDDTEGNEFEIIKNALDIRHMKMEEQEAMIMELLLNHLIYGVPTSEAKLRYLGLAASYNKYCVFLLEGFVLLSEDVERISDEVENRFDVRLFTTDWEDEKQNIIICFMKEDVAEVLCEAIREWFRGRGINEVELYPGRVVEKLDDIKSSLNSCVSRRDTENKALQGSAEKCADGMTDGTGEAGMSREDRQEKRKKDILAYLDLHFTDPNISQVIVADIFGISTFTLSRIFKNQVGIGFQDYLISKRLEYAKDLLLTTSASVSEITMQSGFSNENHFSRTFKCHVGVTPTNYRKQ